MESFRKAYTVNITTVTVRVIKLRDGELKPTFSDRPVRPLHNGYCILKDLCLATGQ